MDGARPYKITFQRDAVIISMVFPDLDFQSLHSREATYYAFYQTLVEVTSNIGKRYTKQVVPSLCQNPKGSGIQVRVCLLPHGLGYEKLIAQLEHAPLPAEFARAAAEVDRISTLVSQDRGDDATL